MRRPISIEPDIEALVMPENLRIAQLVADERKKCETTGRDFEYFGFAFGQSPFPVPSPIIQALSEEAAKGHYSSTQGIAELREAMAGFYGRHLAIAVDPDDIILGSGTKDVLHTIFRSLRGDVVIPSPSWIGYAPQLTMLGKRFHKLHLDPADGYRLNPLKLDLYLRGLAANQHLLVLNNPHNPTGVVYTRSELETLTEVFRRHGTLVIADEIYALTTYDIGQFTSMASVYPEGTFVTNGLSKDRSAGGYRLGACILPADPSGKLRDTFIKVAATANTNVSTPIQHAAVTAYRPNSEIEEYFKITRNIHRIMGEFMSGEVRKIDGIQTTDPAGGFYFYADFNERAEELRIHGVENSNQLGRSMLESPFRIATVTSDAVMLDANDFGARFAFVDYDGQAAYEDYRKHVPSREEEDSFVQRNAPRLVEGVNVLQRYMHEMSRGPELRRTA